MNKEISYRVISHCNYSVLSFVFIRVACSLFSHLVHGSLCVNFEGAADTKPGSKGSGLAVGVAEQYASDLLRKASSTTPTAAAASMCTLA